MARASLIPIVIAVVIRVLAGVALGPRPPTLAGDQSGDPALAGRLRSALPDRGHGQVVVALVQGGRVTYAGFGADEHTPFEIGSVAKALTGMLLAEQVRAGVVRLDQPADTLLPGLPPGSATLQELSQHRSGLPRLPRSPAFLVRGVIAQVRGSDPYAETPAEIVALAAAEGLPGGAEPAYSNLGAAVLGHALGAAEEGDYAAALTARVLTPLRMDETVVVTEPAELPPGQAVGRSGSNGLRTDPWIADGWAPAGSGVWSTSADLGRLVAGALAGTAPGVAALEPTADYADGVRIGLGWITSDVDGRRITWHNGGTGGFSSFVGLDRQSGTGVVLLSASTRSVDDAGLRLLTEAAGS